MSGWVDEEEAISKKEVIKLRLKLKLKPKWKLKKRTNPLWRIKL